MPHLVAIVGAPNVGKSTLFNRLVGRRQAIVTDEPGMTRDRQYGAVRDASRAFRVIDTGGLVPRDSAPFAREIERQASAALDEAAVIVLVVDARAGAGAVEQELAKVLRRRGRPLVLVANKIDGEEQEHLLLELHRLGLGSPIPVSAEHGRGVDELVEHVAALLPEQTDDDGRDEAESEATRVAIVGRPNVGKSSIFNRIVGRERVAVSDIPGTTRDAIDTRVVMDGRTFVLIDTAGLRRPGRVQEAPEHLSVRRAMHSIERSDVAVLVLDATQELAAQDTHIAGKVLRAWRPLVVAVNKWDLVEEREDAARAWEERVRHRLHFAKHVPFRFVSALTGQRVDRLLDDVVELRRAAGIQVPTGELNRWLVSIGPGEQTAPAPRTGFRVLYATQTGVCPPTFLLFCNDPDRAHFSVKRFLENSLRERFGFGGAPIRLRFRSRRDGPRRDA